MHVPCTQTALEESGLSHGVPSSATGSRITKILCSADLHTSWQGVTPRTIEFYIRIYDWYIIMYYKLYTISCVLLPCMENTIEWTIISSCTLLINETGRSLWALLNINTGRWMVTMLRKDSMQALTSVLHNCVSYSLALPGQKLPPNSGLYKIIAVISIHN